MDTVIGIITAPLGWVLNFGYVITGSYGLAILFFALAAKIITFPLTLMAQKNSIRLLQIQPELNHIKRAHYGDRERINEEQYLLYKREKYSPLQGLVPLLAQLVLLIGMVNVIYEPQTHINNLTDVLFCGIDLGVIPSTRHIVAFLALTLLSGLSSFALCAIQNRLNPAQRRMNFWGKWGMSIIIIAFSFYIPLVTPGAIGIYWFFSNTLSIGAAFAANAIYNPKKYVPAEMLAPAPKPSKKERLAAKERKQRISELENKCVERFYANKDKNKLIFYSVSGGQYKYYSEIIDWLLANSEIIIHYITNDPEDKLLHDRRNNLEVYYVGQRRAVGLMLKLDAKMVIMTAPNLGQFHIKRSVVNPDIEYVYTFHHFTSLIMVREEAVDNFDTVFCVGGHQVEEIRKTEQVYNLKPKRLVKTGYGQMDKLLKMYAELPQKENNPPQILIAPSWSIGGILDSCLGEIISKLAGKYKVIIRPHPEYIKRFPDKWGAITRKYENVTFDDDFLSNDSIYSSDLLITDWSNIAYEFSYCTKRPTIFINTPQKIMNGEYHKLGIEPLDVILRSKLGENVDTDKLDTLTELVPKVLAEKEKYSEMISKSVEQYLYHPLRSGEAAGKYILSRLQAERTE